MDNSIMQRQKENEWKKEKAVLEQTIELQELQIKELRKREENYKKFNDTILQAYNSLEQNKQNSKIFKEIQQSLEQYSRELLEQKNRNQDTVLTLETENRDLKAQLIQLQHKIVNMDTQMDELKQTLARQPDETPKPQLFSATKIRNEHQMRIKQLEQDHRQQIEFIKSEALKKLELVENDLRIQLDTQKNLFDLERSELQEEIRRIQEELRRILEEQNQNQINNQNQIQKSHSKKPSELREMIDKENISPLPYMSFKGSPAKSDNEQQSKFKGCIVTAKIKQQKRPKPKIKDNLESDRSTVQTQREVTRASESSNSQILKRKTDLSVSQLLNCKNSNVMEINLLQSSDIFKIVSAQEDQLNNDQSYICGIKMMVQQLQRDKLHIEQLIQELEDRSPSRPNERQILQSQLKQITKELRKARDNLEFDVSKGVESESNRLLKHEIRYMINKLLKAKGQLSESTANSLNVSIHTRQQSKHYAVTSTFNHDKSLTQLTKQLNQARSIENFTQIYQSDIQNQRSRRFATNYQQISRSGRIFSTTNL